jgi:hypothetical protein
MCGENLSKTLEMVITEFPRADHQDHGRAREEFSRALEMFFEFALDLAKRCAGIKDHMNTLTHPFENDLGLLSVQKPTFLLGHSTVSMISA